MIVSSLLSITSYDSKFLIINRAGFKKRKVIRNFREIATYFGKVIRNCEP